MEEKNNKILIDINQVTKKLRANKLLFFKVWGITIVLACIWILPQPRYYKCKVSIAPESSSTSLPSGGIASLASNFGFNLGNLNNTDAIYPQLYPELLKSTDFLVGLLDIKIKTKDGKINTDYYTYLDKYQESSIWSYPFNFIMDIVEQWTNSEEVPASSKNKQHKRFDPFQLSKKNNKILDAITNNVTTNYSKKTDVVTLTVTDQDPLVCALLADSIMNHLQQYIINYRTKKARIDYEHYKNLTSEAKSNYDKARQRYASFSDANEDVILTSVKSIITDLENEMQLKYNIYSAMNARLEAAQAKVQENTPVFTTLTNATVPVKPAGPKRMLFVFCMLFLSTMGTIYHILKKEISNEFSKKSQE